MEVLNYSDDYIDSSNSELYCIHQHSYNISQLVKNSHSKIVVFSLCVSPFLAVNYFCAEMRRPIKSRVPVKLMSY